MVTWTDIEPEIEPDPIREEVWSPPPQRYREEQPPLWEAQTQTLLPAPFNNPIALLLLGVVIGVIIMNMRPIIVNPALK